MKRKNLFILTAALVMTFVLAACDDPSDDPPGEVTRYTVSFESNGGSAVDSQTVVEGDKATRPNNPVKDNFTFDTWYSDAALHHVYDFNTPVTNNITLYAKWLTPFTVSFDSNGGSDVAEQLIGEGNPASRPQNPGKTGFGFAGWFIDEDLTIEYDFDIPVTGDITLYAAWDDNYYTVSFNSMGGSEVDSQNIAHNGTATLPDDPEYSGFGFYGWFIDIDYTDEYDFDTPVTVNITLYAKWGNKIAVLPEDIDDFGSGVSISGEFTVSNTAEWNSAIAAINVGGNGTAGVFKNYIINVVADFAVPGNEDYWSYNRNYTITSNYIKLSLRGKNKTLSLSSNGSMFLLGQQSLVIRDLTLRGRNADTDGTDNTGPLIYVYGGTGLSIDLKGDAVITGNHNTLYYGGIYNYFEGLNVTLQDNARVYGNDVGLYIIGNVTMRDESSVYGNIQGGVVAYGGTLTMLNDTSISNNGEGIGYGTGTVIMRDNASVYGNTGVGINCSELIMQDNSTVYDNDGVGVRFSNNAKMSDDSRIYGNGGGGIAGGTITMLDNSIVSDNTLNITSSITNAGGAGVNCNELSMSGNALITRNILNIIFTGTGSTNAGGGGVRGNVTMIDNASINNNTVNIEIIVSSYSSRLTFGGGGVYGGITIMSGDTSVSDNTINAEITGSFNYTPRIVGGGIFVTEGILLPIIMKDRAEISNNVINAISTNTANQTIASGGGICIDSVCDFTMQDNVKISDNIVNAFNPSYNNVGVGCGGGISILGRSYSIDYIYNDITIQNYASIVNNTVTESGGGISGVINLTMNDNASISGNIAASEGGGVYRANTVIMRNYANISGNDVTGHLTSGNTVLYGTAGGVSCLNLTMHNYASISDNTVTGNTVYGGGVFLDGGLLTMFNNSTISNNIASGDTAYGGGIRSQGGFVRMQDNAQITGNSATIGGGIHLFSHTMMSTIAIMYMLDNSVISNNIATVEGGGGGVYAGSVNTSNSIFRMSGGTVFGNTSGADSNRVMNGTVPVNGSGAALFREANAVTQYGTFSADGETFTRVGDLTTTDNTIRVEDGELK